MDRVYFYFYNKYLDSFKEVEIYIAKESNKLIKLDLDRLDEDSKDAFCKAIPSQIKKADIGILTSKGYLVLTEKDKDTAYSVFYDKINLELSKSLDEYRRRVLECKNLECRLKEFKGTRGISSAKPFRKKFS